MSMMVVALHCNAREFVPCSIAPVRRVLEPYLDPPGFAVGQSRTLRPGNDCGPYEIDVGGWNDQIDVVGGVTIHRADHCPQLWALLLRLSASAKMILMGDALGAVGCIAADPETAEQMPTDTLEEFGPPVITADVNVALNAIAGDNNTSSPEETGNSSGNT